METITNNGFVDDIKATVCDREGVNGAYDLILHSYGPEMIIGSVHIEVPDTMTMEEYDRIGREITRDVFKKHNVILSAVGAYTFDTKDEAAVRIRSDIIGMVKSHDGVKQIHGFHVYGDEKAIVFDLIIDFSIDERESLYSQICSEVRSKYPDYKVFVTLDADV